MATLLQKPFLCRITPQRMSFVLGSFNPPHLIRLRSDPLQDPKDRLNKFYSKSSSVIRPGSSSFSHRNKRNLLNIWKVDEPVPLVRWMAGHSKWQNIRHIKGAKDAEKSKTFGKFTQLIRAAVRDGGNADIKLNQKLALVVQQAKQKNMPTATIEAAIKKQLSSKEKLDQFVMEVKGPGNSFIIISCLSENVTRTKHQIKAILNKISAQLLDSGSTKNFFDYKGVVNVQKSDNITLEKALDDAIEIGAEEVSEAEDEEGNAILQFLSDPKDFYTVKKRLEELNYNVTFAGLEYLPHTTSTLNDNDLERAARLLDLLEDHEEVVKVYDNIA